MAEPERTYSDEQLNSDDVGKKDLCEFLQTHSSMQFQTEHKLKGALKNVVKKKTKDQLVADYKDLFETKAFKQEGEDEAAAAALDVKQKAAEAAAVDKISKNTEKMMLKDQEQDEEVKYRKNIVKKGNKVSFPQKGETITCLYTGRLADGTVFDTNTLNVKRGKKPIPFRIKVGVGLVIRGWDHALQTMSVGEKAELVIQPEWAYGKKGMPEAKIPPHAVLHFEVELLTVEP